MIKWYRENMDGIIALLKKVMGVKSTANINFKMLNVNFDSDMDEGEPGERLAELFDKEINAKRTNALPATLFLMAQESFEYFIKYEDKYNEIKAMLQSSKDLVSVANMLREDCWPFYPFFQETLSLFACMLFPDDFSASIDIETVFESYVRELVFVDSDGDSIPLDFNMFFHDAEVYFNYIYKAKDMINENPKMDFHELTEILTEATVKKRTFDFDFMESYPALKKLVDKKFNEVKDVVSGISSKVLAAEMKGTMNTISKTRDELEFRLSACVRYDDLEESNNLVNDLRAFAIEKYNEYVESDAFKNLTEAPESFKTLEHLVCDDNEGSIDYLYTIIDEKLKSIEARYEKRRRVQMVRDYSIKIQNFEDFLIGLKTEIGDMNDISRKKMGNFTSKAEAELLLKRLKLQKTAYFSHVKVFDYLSLSADLEDEGFKIYKRPDFDHIVSSIRQMEKFLNMVMESIMPEHKKKTESDFENDGELVDIGGNRIRVALMNEDFSELSFGEEEAHTFNIHDYSAYHDLVDYAVDVRKQPVFQDYGDISEYPYFRPFSYQVDNVRTMLGRFEGKGVFGDQVGLGKTLEALMCADVMFRCATIHNAVIVTTKQTIRQWRNEAAVKFRHEDGSPMFEVYPKHDSYSFPELVRELKKDKATKSSNALKIYLVSTEQIKSKDSLEYIRKNGEYFGKKNAAYNPSPDVPSDIAVVDVDLKTIDSFKHLDILKKRLPKELSRVIKESLEENEVYKRLTTYNVYGFFTYEFDDAKKKFVFTNERLYDEKNPEASCVTKEIEILKAYTRRLAELEERRIEIEAELEKMKSEHSYAEERLVDLLIFDEVQDLLYDFNTKGNKEQLLQEFIANIQKKYCILISATPIRNDLSDIFNLLYMVDKNRLGETREKAESKFYNAYCGGCRSLSEMAAAEDSEEKFLKLNGLINSMFTRKRLYDKDVMDSIRRKTATEEEMANAKRHNRDDYGGGAFLRLVSAIRRSQEASDLDQFINRFVKPLFESYDIPEEILKDAFFKMAGYVDESVKICVKRLEYQTRFPLDKFNVYDKYLENYRYILKAEGEDNKDEIYDVSVKTCNLLCSYINRGLMEFYKSKQDYPTVFLGDYIDWRRPRKHGVALDTNTDKEKLELLAKLLTVCNKKTEQYHIPDAYITALETGKVLCYEKKPSMKQELYKAIRTTAPDFGNPRRVYMTLLPSEEAGYELSDFIHFGYFPKGERQLEMKRYMAKLKVKDESLLTFEDKRMLQTYTSNGNILRGEDLEDSFKGMNFRWFTEFTSENENWNSLYFMDKTMMAGTDFNAANVLIIGQLDKADGSYLDPLELEQLIGRISRMGQTEECLVFTCLSNGKGEENNQEFNSIYYDIMTDESGFDLYGVCQTEVDFVMPVVMAVAGKLFGNDVDSTAPGFKAHYKNGYIPYQAVRFPEMVAYAYENNESIEVFYNGTPMKPLDAVRKMIQVYSGILRCEVKNER